MSNNIVHIIKSLSYTFVANLVSLIVSTVVILVVPKILGVSSYGYWQLYVFYASYVGFLHLGWNDGIYLRYGGSEYNELNKETFFSQYSMLNILQILIAFVIFIFVLYYVEDSNRRFVYISISVNLVITNSRYFLIYVLQATNRIRNYAVLTLTDRLVYVIVLIVLLAFGIKDYRYLIYADIFGRIISLIYGSIKCSEIVWRKENKFILTFLEAFENIKVGSKLMFSNIANMMIIGMVRFGIEKNWDISTFGKVSLVLSISNAAMLFVNTVGIVFFPILKRTDQNKLGNLYLVMRSILMTLLLGLLIFSVPLELVLNKWLPNYADSLIYIPLIFPIIAYEGKMVILINTYLKVLRKENMMLKINLISLFISFISTVSIIYFTHNIEILVTSILFLLIIRSSIAEIYLLNILDIVLIKDLLLEFVLVGIFVLLNLLFVSLSSFLLYFVCYLLYLLIKRSEIISSFVQMKRLINTK